MRFGAFLLVAAVALGTGACGGDDDDGSGVTCEALCDAATACGAESAGCVADCDEHLGACLDRIGEACLRCFDTCDSTCSVETCACVDTARVTCEDLCDARATCGGGEDTACWLSCEINLEPCLDRIGDACLACLDRCDETCAAAACVCP